MTKLHAFILFAAIASGLATPVHAENSGDASKAAVVRDADAGTAPAAVKEKAARETKVAKPVAETGKRSVASSTAREGTSDPYAVPLFKDARQLR